MMDRTLALAAASDARARRYDWLAWDTNDDGTPDRSTPADLRHRARVAEADAVDTIRRFVAYGTDLAEDALALATRLAAGAPATLGVARDYEDEGHRLAGLAIAAGSPDAGEYGRVAGDLAAARRLRERARDAEDAQHPGATRLTVASILAVAHRVDAEGGAR